MSRLVRILPVVVLVLGSRAVLAQERLDTARALAEAQQGVNSYLTAVQAQTTEIGREIDILGYLTDAADSVTPIAMGQSLTHARQKVEEAKRELNREPPLPEPVPAVVDIVGNLVTTPPFGTPADQLRARLFVEISKLEEEILRQCQALQSEANRVDALESVLARIRGTLHSTAVSGGRASLITRRRALKSGS